MTVMSNLIRVVVADDHPLYREGVARTLAAAEGLAVVAEAANAEEAEAAVMAHHPDVVILDISMPGDGLEAARRILAARPQTRVAILTVSEDPANVRGALDAGVLAYVLKGIGGEELVRVVRALAAGSSHVAPELAARMLRSPGRVRRDDPSARLAALTKREEDILRLVARGLSNREVATELGLQEKTVKHYMTDILGKLGVRNRVEAALLAQRGWTAPAGVDARHSSLPPLPGCA